MILLSESDDDFQTLEAAERNLPWDRIELEKLSPSPLRFLQTPVTPSRFRTSSPAKAVRRYRWSCPAKWMGRAPICRR